MFEHFKGYTSKSFKFLCILIIVSSCENKNISLVKNGVSDYEIAFLGSATKHNYQSAEILQDYIQKAAKVKLSIVDESSQSAHKHKIYIGYNKYRPILFASGTARTAIFSVHGKWVCN